MAKAIIVCGFVMACASGGQDGGADLDAAVAPRDANSVVAPDAKVRLDGGSTTPDAYVAPTVDAGGGLFCTANSQCTVSGECCLTLGGPSGFCAPGSVVLGTCVPQ